MEGDEGGITLDQADVIGEAGTFVMVEGGMALQMPEGVLPVGDPIKLENITVEGLTSVDAGGDALTQEATLVGEAGPEGQLIHPLTQDVLAGSGLGETLGEQYIINTGEALEGIVGIDGGLMPQAYVPLVMDFESQDFGGMTLAAQIVGNELGGQKMIILTPGTALPANLGAATLQQTELVNKEEEETVELPIIESMPDMKTEATETMIDSQYEEALVEEHDDDEGPSHKKIKLEELEQIDDSGSMVVLTMPENCEEITESPEEVVSNVKITMSSGSKSPKSGVNVKNTETDVTQAWFTTKDDKMALQNKGHQWKQGQWTKEEIDILDKNIASYCVRHQIKDPAEVIFQFTKEERKDFYRTVAKGLQRPLFSVYRRVIRMYDQKNHIGKYTPEEIMRLKELRSRHGSDWATIGAALGRSASSVKDRCRLMRDTCNSGKWLPDEESVLTQAVYDLSGCSPGESVTKGLSWAAVAERVGTRSEKQCRTKWLNFLNWKQQGGTDWTREDDIMLINKLIMTEAEDETLVDWNDLSENWPSARSPQWLRGKWWTLKRHVPEYQTTSLPDLLKSLKKVHFPKAQIKPSLAQGLGQSGKVDLQQLGLLPNMTLIPVSAGADGISGLGEEVVASQGLEIYPSYTGGVISSQPQGGAFLLTPQPGVGAAAGTITMAGSVPTDHIIVHTLPIGQDGVIQQQTDGLPEGVTISLNPQTQQVIIPTGDAQNGVACLAPQNLELQLQGISGASNDLHELAESSELHVPEDSVSRLGEEQLQLQSGLEHPTEILQQEGHVDFESQLSESELAGDVAQTGLEHVGITDVTSAAQFVQSTSNDFIENMSSLSDPMLPSESADLIGSCSDTETDKPVTDPSS